MAKFKVLSTKKLKPSLVIEANQKDIEIIEKEFISVQPIYTEEKKKQITDSTHSKDVVITSFNAVEVLEYYLGQSDININWNIYCISGRTREFIEKSNTIKGKIIATADNGAELAKKIIDNGCKNILFFCGDKRRDELPRLLTKAGVFVNEIVLYNTEETAIEISDRYDGILFFSPSSVSSFFSINKVNNEVVCFAIGHTTADSIKTFIGNKCIISESPTQEGMITAAESYFQNINCIK